MGFTVVCDPGIDDVAALAVLAGSGVEPDVVVATSGNVAARQAARIAAGACALLGIRADVAVAETGSARRAGDHHGSDGFAGLAERLPPGRTPRPARADDLAGDVLALAPLTSLRGNRPARLLWQGGGFNAAADTAAAADVIRGGDLVVPVEVSERVRLPLDLVPDGLLGDAVRWLVGDGPSVVLHDAVAAVAWLQPELFKWSRDVAVDVDIAAADRLLAAARWVA